MKKGGVIVSNLEIMKKELHKTVILPLLEQGFTGKWPHFRREHEETILKKEDFRTGKVGVL